VAFGKAVARADAALTNPAGFGGDVSALVGADRADGYSFLVKQEIEGGFEQLFGLTFPSPTAVVAAGDQVITAAIDHAYARPFDLLEAPHPPAPGKLAATRQVVADALLLHLAAMDLTDTEFGRSLDELTRMFRAGHVQALRNFRENVAPEDFAGRDVYIGKWLDPHVEVSVDRSTGTVVDLLFEID
jgi:hypothetical protein